MYFLWWSVANFQFKIKNKYGIELGAFPSTIDKVHAARRGGRRAVHTSLLQV